ncbi:type II toxin-antitoxin system RelE/ParE family toxin [Methylomonas sp. AM2-LC]|uniref:type II toxin-antitoxin system RelE family toxin n=1 Tax=Methylomonas sp. AM2-LC TaxID=3153301 RepID=UPI0032662257
MYKITYLKSAVKALTKLPQPFGQRIIASMKRIAECREEGLDIKKLEGRSGYRLRMGSYRVIYEKFENELLIEVIKIGSRGDIYK